MEEHMLFSTALGLERPWKVVEIEFSKDKGCLDLTIDFQKGATFPCSSCAEGRCPVHDTKERTWRHLNPQKIQKYPRKIDFGMGLD